MTFEETYLNDNILDALYDMRFEEMTPIQEKCIPEMLDGRDVLGVAQTGTGKTAAYLLPILSMLDDGYADFPDGRHIEFPQDAINCVIMAPTRELAQQIDQAMQGFGYYLPNVSSVAVYGGNDGNRYYQELNALKTGASVIIATPGRFISHLTMDNVDMSRVSFFVLDEADRMLDMGFSDDILKIASYLPKTCQTVMFSATMPDKIEQLAKSLLTDPVEVKIAVSKPAEKIQQSAYVCYEAQKLKIIQEMFKQGDLKRVIIFAGKINKVKDVYHALLRMKINAGQMHSDLSQAERDEMMFRFKSGQVDVLVATDILSRGIDIDDIAMVVNYDVPRDAEDYVHRIGRTARAERDGKAVTFINEEDVRYFMQIERFLEREVIKNPLPEGIGEGPEYKATRSSSGCGKGRRRGRGGKRRHEKKGGPKSAAANAPQEEAQKKRKRPRKKKTQEAAKEA
jgi:superfamily II DNA/RNA helicase